MLKVPGNEPPLVTEIVLRLTVPLHDVPPCVKIVKPEPLREPFTRLPDSVCPTEAGQTPSQLVSRLVNAYR